MVTGLDIKNLRKKHARLNPLTKSRVLIRY